VIFLRKIFPDSPLLGKRIKPYRGGGEKLLYLIREERLIPFVEPIEMEEGDILLAFVHEEEADAMERWFNGL
jgi:Trk K+ transport system NAD-binding subunit